MMAPFTPHDSGSAAQNDCNMFASQEKGQEAMQAEEAFQRQLAKKLGIKGKAAQQYSKARVQQEAAGEHFQAC